ncbi:hypothetical protein NEFER03_1429 [Nematocida sp. LUAm3]|nr:hypothetical protein NEFER03_1429 [Nematocida sp. LUAm3]KAI5174741.1 hypothetical protein NEFER02_0851 [Nematocida sp. LUAm2]KAI5177848.1 hypothetical protein NEFER01_1050 [Nematocida sp. LUAm1]
MISHVDVSKKEPGVIHTSREEFFDILEKTEETTLLILSDEENPLFIKISSSSKTEVLSISKDPESKSKKENSEEFIDLVISLFPVYSKIFLIDSPALSLYVNSYVLAFIDAYCKKHQCTLNYTRLC